jgi:hypothetical protein
MMYDHGWARERGCAMFGPAKTESEEDSCEFQFTKSLKSGSMRVWRKTRFRAVLVKKELLSAISLAENTSQNAMELPPREVIDKIRVILETEEEPAWYKIYCCLSIHHVQITNLSITIKNAKYPAGISVPIHRLLSLSAQVNT